MSTGCAASEGPLPRSREDEEFVSMKVMHVVATAQRRGAEIFASDLVRALDGVSHRVMVLRNGIGSPLRFEAPTTMGRDGRRVPGLRIDAATLRGLRACLGEFRPDVVQAHGGEALKYAVFAARASRVPVVYRKIGAATLHARRWPGRGAHA